MPSSNSIQFSVVFIISWAETVSRLEARRFHRRRLLHKICTCGQFGQVITYHSSHHTILKVKLWSIKIQEFEFSSQKKIFLFFQYNLNFHAKKVVKNLNFWTENVDLRNTWATVKLTLSQEQSIASGSSRFRNVRQVDHFFSATHHTCQTVNLSNDQILRGAHRWDLSKQSIDQKNYKSRGNPGKVMMLQK